MSEPLFETLLGLSQRLNAVETTLNKIEQLLSSQRLQKEWYSTTELAEALGKSQFTVTVRYCAEGRIVCEKDEAGKWRIPGHEYRRLVEGGALRSKHNS